MILDIVWMITAGSSGNSFRNLTDGKETWWRRVIVWECENQLGYCESLPERPAKWICDRWMQKEELPDDTVQFKRARQKNKSELILHFAKNLGETKRYWTVWRSV